MKIAAKFFQVLRSMRNEKGVSMIEYGLLAALVAIAAVVAITSIGTNLDAKFKAVSSELD